MRDPRFKRKKTACNRLLPTIGSKGPVPTRLTLITWNEGVCDIANYVELGWKTCGYYYETVETHQPQATPTQGKIRSKVAFGPLLPTANSFSWVGNVLYRKQTTINPIQPDSSQTAYYCQPWCSRYRPVQGIPAISEKNGM